MSLLSPELYDSIRAVLDASLDSTALPDSMIASAPFAPRAERWIITSVPTADDAEGADLASLTLAAIYYCAALLAPSLPSLTAQRAGDLSISRQGVDWNARAAELLAKASDELLLVATSESAVVTHFTVAHGYRGRSA